MLLQFFFFLKITSFRECACGPPIVATVEEKLCDCKEHNLKCRKGICWEPGEMGGVEETGDSHGAQAAELHLGERLLLPYEFLLISLGFCRQLHSLGPSSQRSRAGSGSNLQIECLIMPFLPSYIMQFNQLIFILHCCFFLCHLMFCISLHHSSFLCKVAAKLFGINATILIKIPPSLWCQEGCNN